MNSIRAFRAGAAVLAAVSLGACSTLGNVGDILGGVLGGGAAMVAGVVRGVNTQSQQISLQDQSGQTVSLQYDNQTKVVYNSQNYPVSALDPGDQVSAHVQQTQGGAYYTDSIAVVQPANGTGAGTTTGGTVQALSGTVRQVDYQNGLFVMDAGNSVTLTVSMPYNASSTDRSRFNALRVNDYVSIYGVYLSSSRVELRQFR